MTLVLDASFSLAWIFQRERADQAEQADRALRSRGRERWFVPCLWPLEVANALLVAERRGVIQPDLRLGARLASFDRRLMRAADAEGCGHGFA